jgi:hypothetical protein
MGELETGRGGEREKKRRTMIQDKRQKGPSVKICPVGKFSEGARLQGWKIMAQSSGRRAGKIKDKVNPKHKTRND